VTRRLGTLEQNGLLEVENRNRKDGGFDSNEYNFDGLIDQLTPFARKKVLEREERARHVRAEGERKAKEKMSRAEKKRLMNGGE